MPDHHYRVGQMVALTAECPSGTGSDGGRLYKIIQLLPAAWGGTCYRIKSIVEEADRIVPEANLGDETCISRDVWDRMLAPGSLADREARSPHAGGTVRHARAMLTYPTRLD